VSACGLWATSKRLCAVIIDDTGTARPPISAARTPQACATLLAWLSTTNVRTLVLSECSGALIAQAHAANLSVHIAPHELFEAIRIAAGLIHRPHRYTAGLLARWPLSPGLRRHLRQIFPQEQLAQQIPLL
jgi:hypothetical protein